MKLKERPEDFKVFEILSEEPKKKVKDRYRYYKLFKRGMETIEAIKEISKVSRLRLQDILYGGLKDKNAEAYQFIAVREPKRLKEFKSKKLGLKFVGWLSKPPREVLKGNRFELVVKDVSSIPDSRLKVLTSLGVPNYYGEQRFTSIRGGKFFILELLKGAEFAIKYLFTPAGWEGSNSRRAKKLFLKGEFREAAQRLGGWRKEVSKYLAKGGSWEGALNLIPKGEIEFQANVLQSYLFNRLLSQFIFERTSKTLKFKYKLGYLYYPLESVKVALELPLFTPEVDLYDKFLEELGVKREELKPFKEYFHQFKRKTFVRPEGFSYKEVDCGFVLNFFLPTGSYATNLLRFLFSAVGGVYNLPHKEIGGKK